ncbi:MAG: serine hydrolase domain-containing protein [Thermoleophilia bacterium]
MATFVTPTGTPAHLEHLGFTEQTWDQPWNLLRGHLTMLERMPSAILTPWGTVAWPKGTTLDLDQIEALDPLTDRPITLPQLLDYRLRSDGLMIIKDGRVLAERYANGMRDTDHHVVHSCSKTLTAMMVGIAIDAGRLDPASSVQEHITELASISAWDGVSVQHILDMTAGLNSEEHYEDPDSMYWRYADAVGYYGAAREPAGTLGFVTNELRERVEEPGFRFNYASYLSNLLPVILERTYGRSAVELYEECLYSKIGAEDTAIINVDAYGRPIVEGQVNITLRDFARWAYPLANGGVSLTGEQVISAAWIDETMASSPERAAAFERGGYVELMPGAEYHNQAWLLDPSEGVLAMLGIHGQFAFYDRPRDLLIVGMSSFPDQTNALMVELLNRAWAAIGTAI